MGYLQTLRRFWKGWCIDMNSSAKIILSACCVLLLCACGVQQSTNESVDSSEGTVSTVAKKVDNITDYHLRDNDSLYLDHDRTSVVTMYLTIGPGNSEEGTDHTWQEINSLSAYYYTDHGIPRYKVSALLQVGDENGPLAGEVGYGERVPNATVQIRGQTSSRNSQKNYKIELKDNKGLWNDQQTINLNKHMMDGLRFRNKMMYDLLSEVPQIMALRTQFVHLYVKDAAAGETEFSDYGLYTQVEQLNKRGMRAHGLDRNGHLYKTNHFEFYRYEDVIKTVDDPTYDEAAFEYRLEIKGNRDHTKLIQLLEAINSYSVTTEELFDTYVDEENIAYWMAYMMLTGNYDTSSRNMFLFSPQNSTKWYIIPWDNDASLRSFENSIRMYSDGGSWEEGVSNYWGNMLFRRCLMSEDFLETLDKAVQDLMDNYLTREWFENAVAEYRSVTELYVYRMPDILNAPLTRTQYDMVAQKLYDEVTENYRKYQESLQKPMPFYVGIPEKKETGLHVNWDVSYPLDGQPVRYDVSLAKDYNFRQVLAQKSDLFLPETELDVDLEPGQYFLRVRATNEAGKTQGCFDYYVIDSGKVYDTYCFYVLEDGTCVPDIYEE